MSIAEIMKQTSEVIVGATAAFWVAHVLFDVNVALKHYCNKCGIMRHQYVRLYQWNENTLITMIRILIFFKKYKYSKSVKKYCCRMRQCFVQNRR